MDEQAFVDRMMAATQRQQKPREYTDFNEWREAWFEAWVDAIRRHRAHLDARATHMRQHIAENQRLTVTGKESPHVQEALLKEIASDSRGLAAYALLTAYLDAEGKEAQRRAAGALADHIDGAWCLVGDHYADDDPYRLIVDAGSKWSAPSDAGAVMVRMRRIAEKGSATPLDGEEAEWMMLVELRHGYQAQIAHLGTWYRRDYRWLQERLHALKWIALIDAAEHWREALLIGDTTGTEAAEHEHEVVDAMFGGNLDEYGRVIWERDLTDDQRAAWDHWQAAAPAEELQWRTG